MQTNFAKYSIFGLCFMFFNQGHQECSFQQTICLTYCKQRKWHKVFIVLLSFVMCLQVENMNDQERV